MRGVKLHPWLQGFSAHEPGLDPLCEVAAAAGVPILFHDGTPPFSTPLQLASLARRHPAHDRRPRARRAAGSLAGGDPAVTDDGERPPLHVRRRRPTRCGRSWPAARSSGCCSEPTRAEGRAAPSLRRAPDQAARGLGLSSVRAGCDPGGQPPASARRGTTMIDIHTHVPTHRDAVPPGEEVVNDEVAARPAGLRHDDVGRVRGGVRRGRRLGRVHDRPRPRARAAPTSTTTSPPSSRRAARGGSASSPCIRRSQGVDDELERATGDLGLKGIKLGPNYQIFDPLGRRGAAAVRLRREPRPADPLPPGAPRRCGRRRSATRIRC